MLAHKKSGWFTEQNSPTNHFTLPCERPIIFRCKTGGGERGKEVGPFVMLVINYANLANIVRTTNPLRNKRPLHSESGFHLRPDIFAQNFIPGARTV